MCVMPVAMNNSVVLRLFMIEREATATGIRTKSALLICVEICIFEILLNLNDVCSDATFHC